MANYKEKGYDLNENGYWKGTTTGPNHGYPKNYFYAGTMRSISVAFTNFFNDLYVVRYNEEGEPIKNIQVPIKFGPRMKAFDQRKEIIEGKTYYISYPNLAWRFDGIEFDTERYSGQYAERVFYNDTLEDMGIDYTMSDKFWGDTQPVPYNINISMELKCDLLSDATQVIEQICARFTPDVSMNIKEFWFFNKRRSISLVLNGAPSMNIESESMGEEDKREITVTFSFKAEAWLYKPIKNAVIIDKINTYITAKNSTEEWQYTMYGNYQENIKERYDFQDIYNCKIGPVSAIDRIEKVPEKPGPEEDFTVNYYWKATNDYRFYPEGKEPIKSEKYVYNYETSGYDVNKEYYDIGAFGDQPQGIGEVLETKQLFNSYGEPYLGYYVKEIEVKK